MPPNFSTESTAARTCNFSLYREGQKKGHYESYFQRANHPTRPLAFWIRYTIFVPNGAPDRAIGELWAIYFDGEKGEHTAVKRELPIAKCHFGGDAFSVDVGGSTLDGSKLAGEAESGGHTISWDLAYASDAAPLLLFPLKYYDFPLPKAKALVGSPFAAYTGSITVDGEEIEIDGWIGSQNHNWGSKHTDHYAWAQVAGFDNHPDAFLELGTGRLKFGPVWTPFMTIVKLRLGDQLLASSTILKGFKNWGRFSYFDWSFRIRHPEATISGRVRAKKEDFVALTYYNPPGGNKTCINSKIAACEVLVTYKDDRAPVRLTTNNRAAFELLVDDSDHGLTPRV